MKVTYTRILARKIFLAFLAFVIILSIAALFVRDSIAKKLENISRSSNKFERARSTPAQALLLLHQAEDDFQEALVNADSNKIRDYRTKLSAAFVQIDASLKEKTDTTGLTTAQRTEIRNWYGKKLELSGKLFVLKRSFDSLLNVYADFNASAVKNPAGLSTVLHTGKTDVRYDTLKNPVKKRGLIKRIKDAIVNKDGNTPRVTEIRRNTTTKETDVNARKIISRDKAVYTNKLRQLQQQNVKLLNMQRELVAINTRIINELDSIINGVRDLNYNMAGEFRGMALKSYQESTALLNKLYLMALFLVLMFATLLIVFIVQLNGSELQLRKEIERSVAIAQQKMDLLHHMSHEIRNPLTAIKGFLYIFSKSNMSSKQVDMLDSIKVSSEMMLRTLNDTLDAAKMENSELRINTEPFNPDQVLKTIVESMAFSATKKNLSITCNFKGNKETVLLGDSFRLKQIMVNLLSNAIKYTSEGGIIVNAQLTGGDHRLQVDVIDTGAGISQEQQSGLFSKYYQTNSSKGQVGTGLGLFICSQLVKLQDGRISVKSNPGAGTTFSFYIPYQKSEVPPPAAANASPADPLSIFSGKSLLAVDDNPLNLMFLKKLTDKWEFIFHQASDGKEALDILTKNTVNVVLTDLQMPVMDGKKLLSVMKRSDGAFTRLPVIAISGAASDPEEEEKLIQMGFSGIIAKPFIEADLVEKLMKALQ